MLDETLMLDVEFRTETLAHKYECNARKSVLSLIVLTFCEKYLFDLILQLMCTLIFRTFVSKFQRQRK